MKIKAFYFIILIITFNPCNSQTLEVGLDSELNEYILLNEHFVNTIKDKVLESQIKAINEEKRQFISNNINDSSYLKVLNRLIETPYVNYNDVFFDTQLKKLANENVKETKVKCLYFLNMQLEGGSMILKYNLVIIEDIDRQIDIFSFSNKNFEIKHKKVSDYLLMDLIHEYMLNIPYSFESKSLFNNNAQYFTLERVTPIDKNNYSVESVVVPRMLYFQLEIFKALLGFEI